MSKKKRFLIAKKNRGVKVKLKILIGGVIGVSCIICLYISLLLN